MSRPYDKPIDRERRRFARSMKQLRKGLGLSMAEFGQALSYSRESVCEYENELRPWPGGLGVKLIRDLLIDYLEGVRQRQADVLNAFLPFSQPSTINAQPPSPQ